MYVWLLTISEYEEEIYDYLSDTSTYTIYNANLN